MNLRFTKMHGLGNDYVYVDCFEQRLDGVDLPALSRAVSNRHRGIGSDGLILICPPTAESPTAASSVGRGSAGASPSPAHARMEMYNADGSRGEMCGNGIRCVAKYLVDHGLVKDTHLRIETDRGVLELEAITGGGKVQSVRVNMGLPILRPEEIPVRVDDARCVKAPLQVDDERLEMTCVSMGNPHAVFFVSDVRKIDLERVGPLIERHSLFPNRVNVHFVTALSRGEAIMRTWERGSGITQACGTGACATLVAGILEGRLDRSATLHLPGGDLQVEWKEGESGDVWMTGPAVEVFSGTFSTEGL